MKKFLKILYTFLPKKIINFLGRIGFLKSIRNSLLRPDKKEVIIKEKISWGNGNFYFYAPIKMAVKAKQRGIENKLLKNTIKLIEKYKIEHAVILDVGANYGFISLALNSNLNNQTKIYAFEPHPDIFNAVKKSISANNFTNIEIENVAVGSEDCDIEINLYGQTSNVALLDNNTPVKSKVKQINLDNYLTSKNIIPNFIKIDVDGYELNVLKGLQETLKKYKPILVAETNDDIKVIEFLKMNNYDILDLNLETINGMPNNVFCIPQK